MDQNNIKFISNPASFLEYNILTVVGTADVKHQGKNNKIWVAQLDLVKSGLRPLNRGCAVDVTFYEPPLPPPQGMMNRMQTAVGLTAKPQVPDAVLRAYWLPWAPDTIVDRDLDEQGVRFFFTAGFSGCSFNVSGDSEEPHVCHSNMVKSSTMPLPNVRPDNTGTPTLHNRPNNTTGYELPDLYGTQLTANTEKAIANNLCAARQKANITMPDMARKLGVPVEDLEALERGQYSGQKLKVLTGEYALVLRIPVDQLRAIPSQTAPSRAPVSPKTFKPTHPLQQEPPQPPSPTKDLFTRKLTREEKYNRVYLGQELKTRVRALQSGGAYQHNIPFSVMSFEDYGGAQDESANISAQACVVGYKTLNGHWRFVSQYHKVEGDLNKTITLVEVKCVVCKQKPSACTCPG